MRPELVNPILSPWLHWREICILDGGHGDSKEESETGKDKTASDEEDKEIKGG